MCECTGGGFAHTRGQLNKCQQCSGWLDEVWRGQGHTRTFVRFMISRMRDTRDSSLGDRVNIQKDHGATMSEYDWVPPQRPDGKRRAYYSSSMTGRSHEYATKELWMVTALFKQLMRGRFRVGEDSAPTSRYVRESDVCGTNGVDRRSWERQTRPHMHSVHNRCTSDRACSCECAIKRALSDLEMNIDISDTGSSTPDSASGSAVVAEARPTTAEELHVAISQANN